MFGALPPSCPQALSCVSTQLLCPACSDVLPLYFTPVNPTCTQHMQCQGCHRLCLGTRARLPDGGPKVKGNRLKVPQEGSRAQWSPRAAQHHATNPTFRLGLFYGSYKRSQWLLLGGLVVVHHTVCRVLSVHCRRASDRRGSERSVWHHHLRRIMSLQTLKFNHSTSITKLIHSQFTLFQQLRLPQQRHFTYTSAVQR